MATVKEWQSDLSEQAAGGTTLAALLGCGARLFGNRSIKVTVFPSTAIIADQIGTCKLRRPFSRGLRMGFEPDVR